VIVPRSAVHPAAPAVPKLHAVGAAAGVIWAEAIDGQPRPPIVAATSSDAAT
jgi:hypothetical protein